jgi:hypothetical protein
MRKSVRAFALSLCLLGFASLSASAQGPGVVSRAADRPAGRLGPQVVPRDAQAIPVPDATRVAAGNRPEIVRILAQFGGAFRLCTGVMIAPRVALTSGRCVHRGAGGDFALEYWVAPGHDGTNAPYGQAFGALLYAFQPWVDSSDPAFDLGFVVLDRALGDASGWVEPTRSDGCGAYDGTEFSWAGYYSFSQGQLAESARVASCSDIELALPSTTTFSSGLPLLAADRRLHGASSTSSGGTLRFTRINATAMNFFTEYLQKSLDPCDARVEAERSEFGSGGGEAQIAVTTGQGCSWNSDGPLPSWVQILQGSGVSFGRPIVQVAANTGAARGTVINIAGRQVTIAQAGAGTAPNVRYDGIAFAGGSIVHTTVDTSGGAPDPQAPAPLGVAGTGAWWRWTAPTSIFTTIAVTGDAATGIGVYTGRPGALTVVAEGQERVSFIASAGVSYIIYGASIPAGDGRLNLVAEQLFAGAEAQTGWWWNPAEPGRGVFLETNGPAAFMGWFAYDQNGANLWLIARGDILTRRFFRTPLSSFRDGTTLSGPYRAPTFVGNSEPVSVAFPTATTATMETGTATVTLERFAFVPGGTAADRASFAPETGWWWAPSEPGNGYAIEVQGTVLMLGIAHFDAGGAPRWSLAIGTMISPHIFETNATSFDGGQALGQTYRAPTTSSDSGRLSIVFQDARHATLYLPGGRAIQIERFQY